MRLIGPRLVGIDSAGLVSFGSSGVIAIDITAVSNWYATRRFRMPTMALGRVPYLAATASSVRTSPRFLKN